MNFSAFVNNVMPQRPLKLDSFSADPTYAAWLWRCSAEVAGGRSLGAVGRRIRFLYSGWKHQDLLRHFWGSQDVKLGRLVSERPRILDALIDPYQSTDWDVRTRLHKLRAHYETMEELDWLFDPLTEREVELCRLATEDPQLRLVLDDSIWFKDEGPLVLNLFLGDTRMFSLAFALRFEQGALIAHVGAVQGRNAVDLPDVKDIYRDLTRAAFGMRPRDLLIEAFRLLCQHLGVQRIFLVSDDHQQRRDAFFAVTRHEVHAPYDAIWLERGAWRLDKSTFELPLHAKHRDAADIPSRKRRQYERRYAMLDAASEGIAAGLKARRGNFSTSMNEGRNVAECPA